MRLSSALLLLLLLPWSLHAQEGLSLQQCLAYAKTNHLSVQMATNEVVSTKERVGEGLALFMPQVNGSFSFDDNLKRPTTIIPAGVFSPQEIQIQFGNQFTTNAVVQLDQLIYDQSVINLLKANKPLVELYELRKEKSVQDVAYSTATAYFQVLVVKEQRKLLEQNAEKFARIEKIVRLQVEKGVARKVDLERVVVGLSSLQTQVDMLKNNETLLINRLKLTMGMPIEQNIALSDSLSQRRVDEMPVISEFDESKLLDVQIMEKNLRLQEVELSRQSATRLPSISAYGRYGAQAFGNEFGQSFENWFSYSTIGLKMNVPIFSGLRRMHQINQAEIALENARHQTELNTQGLEMRNENARVSLVNAYNSLASTTTNLKLAESVFQTTELEYNKGVGTLSDFLNSEYALKEAQSNYVRALLNYLSARLDYELSLGTLENYLQTL